MNRTNRVVTDIPSYHKNYFERKVREVDDKYYIYCEDEMFIVKNEFNEIVVFTDTEKELLYHLGRIKLRDNNKL